MTTTEGLTKLTPVHLSRKAVVYIRQSSLAQVRDNRESQRLQYALKDTAKGHGFERVEIIDCDLGASAAGGDHARVRQVRLARQDGRIRPTRRWFQDWMSFSTVLSNVLDRSFTARL